MAKKTGGKGTKTTRTRARASSSASTASGDATSYTLGPQDDGSIVVRIENDFDLMVLRKACEKQKKNATAATGTVSALADGEDPFIDAVERSLDRLISAIARARAPENQIKGTPIGDAINEAGAGDVAGDGRTDGDVENASDAADENATHHSGTRRWSNAIPRPRPKAGDRVQLPDGTQHEVVDALGFKGDGLTGSESSDELQKLADDGKLTGVFELIVKDRSENVFVRQQPLHHDSSVSFETWRVVGRDDEYAVLDASEVPGTSGESSGNIATSVSDIVQQSSGSATRTTKGGSKGMSAAPKTPSTSKKKRGK